MQILIEETKISILLDCKLKHKKSLYKFLSPNYFEKNENPREKPYAFDCYMKD